MIEMYEWLCGLNGAEFLVVVLVSCLAWHLIAAILRET